MKKQICTLLVMPFLASLAGAQDVVSQGLDLELQKEIIEESGPAPNPQGQVLIINQAQRPSGPSVTAQPTTFVEDSPLSQSRADRLRKRRQDAEVQTEQKIVEKLEQSRLSDEAQRAERLFGDRLQNPDVQAQPVAPVQQAPAVAVVPVEPAVDSETLKNEISEEIRADLAKMNAKKEKKKGRNFMSVLVGLSEYPDLYNVESNFAGGVAAGWMLPNNFVVEAMFLYSNYYVAEDFFAYREMDQYNLAVAAKYQFPMGTITPGIGALVGYTYREYSEPDSGFGTRYGYGYGNSSFSNQESSAAFDMGLVAGIDFEISKSLVLGLDFKHIINLTSRTDVGPSFYNFNGYNGRDPIEEANTQMVTLTGKFMF